MAEEERKQAEKVATLVAIALRPDTFKWKLQDKVFDKSTLLKEVSAETETGKLVVELMQRIAGEAPKEGSYKLGKRAVCLLCGTELLIVKSTDSLFACCGQNMEITTPKVISSSD